MRVRNDRFWDRDYFDPNYDDPDLMTPLTRKQFVGLSKTLRTLHALSGVVGSTRSECGVQLVVIDERRLSDYADDPEFLCGRCFKHERWELQHPEGR